MISEQEVLTSGLRGPEWLYSISKQRKRLAAKGLREVTVAHWSTVERIPPVHMIESEEDEEQVSRSPDQFPDGTTVMMALVWNTRTFFEAKSIAAFYNYCRVGDARKAAPVSPEEVLQSQVRGYRK